VTRKKSGYSDDIRVFWKKYNVNVDIIHWYIIDESERKWWWYQESVMMINIQYYSVFMINDLILTTMMEINIRQYSNKLIGVMIFNRQSQSQMKWNEKKINIFNQWYLEMKWKKERKERKCRRNLNESEKNEKSANEK